MGIPSCPMHSIPNPKCPSHPTVPWEVMDMLGESQAVQCTSQVSILSGPYSQHPYSITQVEYNVYNVTMDEQINTKYQTAAILAEAISMKKGRISRVNQDGLYSQMNILIVERWNTETSEKYCMFISMKRTALYARVL